jgi:hypothetical protein
MAQFTASRGSFTPVAHATQADNMVLTVLTAGQVALVKMIGWGGRSTTSTGYRTRWGRVNNTPATPTALSLASTNPGVTPIATCNTYATQATLAADPLALWAQDWNSLGGGGVIVLPIGGEWMVGGGALGSAYNQIACGNIAGTEASLTSYDLTWTE